MSGRAWIAREVPGIRTGADQWLQKRAEVLGATTFLGVPVRDFELGGREHFICLLAAGLTPQSKLIDLGSGVLRLGYWPIHFLDPFCYCGIEPHPQRLAMGVDTILEAEIRESKRPRFHSNPGFDTSVFGEKFDFFLAYSIWTHACKQQIRTMLEAFLRDASDESLFLTSYLPAGEGRPDYQGEKWNGTSHESDIPGCIYHSLGWIKAECRQRGLLARELGQDRTYGQSWLAVARAGAARAGSVPTLFGDLWLQPPPPLPP